MWCFISLFMMAEVVGPFTAGGRRRFAIAWLIILITVTTPSYMSPMFSDHRGWLMLIGSGVWMGLGIFVMARMINFKF